MTVSVSRSSLELGTRTASGAIDAWPRCPIADLGPLWRTNVEDALGESSSLAAGLNDAIRELEEALGRASTLDELNNVVATTRPAKTAADEADLLADWWDRARRHGLTPTDLHQSLGQAKPTVLTAKLRAKILAAVGDAVTAERSIFSRAHVLASLVDLPHRDRPGPLIVPAATLERLADEFQITTAPPTPTTSMTPQPPRPATSAAPPATSSMAPPRSPASTTPAMPTTAPPASAPNASASSTPPAWLPARSRPACARSPDRVTFSDTWGASRSGGRSHQGVDMFADEGTPVIAVAPGRVEHYNNSLGGLSYRLYADDGTFYYGTHLSAYETKAPATSKPAPSSATSAAQATPPPRPRTSTGRFTPAAAAPPPSTRPRQPTSSAPPTSREHQTFPDDQSVYPATVDSITCQIAIAVEREQSGRTYNFELRSRIRTQGPRASRCRGQRRSARHEPSNSMARDQEATQMTAWPPPAQMTEPHTDLLGLLASRRYNLSRGLETVETDKDCD